MAPSDDTGNAAPSLERQGAFADRDAWTAQPWCRLERALAVVGTRSAMLLLREALYGATRFDELVRRSGLSEATAATRLKELVTYGLLTRRPYREAGARTRDEYLLTDLGRATFPTFVALMQWGEHLEEDHDTGVELIHRTCGARLTTSVRCANDHPVDVEDAAVRLKSEPRSTTAPRRDEHPDVR